MPVGNSDSLWRGEPWGGVHTEAIFDGGETLARLYGAVSSPGWSLTTDGAVAAVSTGRLEPPPRVHVSTARPPLVRAGRFFTPEQNHTRRVGEG